MSCLLGLLNFVSCSKWIFGSVCLLTSWGGEGRLKAYVNTPAQAASPAEMSLPFTVHCSPWPTRLHPRALPYSRSLGCVLVSSFPSGFRKSVFTDQLFFFFILKSLLNLLPHCFYFMFWFFGHKACAILTP